MMPQLMHAVANEQSRDRERSIAVRASRSTHGPLRRTRRPNRLAVRCGNALISIGCRLAAPDLVAPAR